MNFTIPDQVAEIARIARERAEKRARAGPVVPRPPVKRHHGKRHSVNRERSREQKAKAIRARIKVAKWIARRRAISAAMRAYFRGETPDLSSIAHLL